MNKKNNFNDYYASFLGKCSNNLNEKTNIYSTDYRNKTIAFSFLHFLIATKFNNNTIYSIAPQFYQSFKNNFNYTINNEINNDLLKKIDDFFINHIKGFYAVRKMLRLTTNEQSFKPKYMDIARKLTLKEKDKYLNFISNRIRGDRYNNKQWLFRKNIIKYGRMFVVLENNRIISYAEISNINFNGANIVVKTLPDYRKKGYAKAVVSKVTEWCLQKKIIPIYWVDSLNKASIHLAKSLGYNIVSEEIIVSINK